MEPHADSLLASEQLASDSYRIEVCGMGDTTAWQEELENNITTIEQLKEYIKITSKQEKQLRRVIEKHPMSITRYYMSLIDANDPNDPLRKLAVPSEEELDLAGSYDPSCEKDNTKMPGLQHKYYQTALILATNRCATYCRHCFRKRLVGLPNNEILRRFNGAIDYIREHEDIDNVLVTGGDPLILPTEIIEEFLKLLTDIPHMKYIRFGTRVPVTFPERITEDEKLLEVFSKYSNGDTRVYVVTHFNHPREITQKSISAIKKLLDANVSINNQTVLLRGVNDDADILAELFNKLLELGVLPYYLFQCRPVKRAKRRFSVPLYEGYEIFENAKKKVKGHILCKRVKYVMSHTKGKIEIVGVSGDEIYLKYHRAKDPKNRGKFFKRKLNKTAGWLDELKGCS